MTPESAPCAQLDSLREFRFCPLLLNIMNIRGLKTAKWTVTDNKNKAQGSFFSLDKN